ncbi:MAG: hypothetical protein PHO02_00540 [Candidatus Nanoarchaeia archaeon]|nr:hypothetical protein [Candidatus Nanoarchaeia archaeon]
MQSGNIKEHALKAIKEHPQVFESLAEYDRTRKLQRTVYKERATFTIDANILRKFRAYAKEHGMDMSKIVEKQIKQVLGLK